MRQRSSSSSKARSLLRAPSRSLARANSPRKRRGSIAGSNHPYNAHEMPNNRQESNSNLMDFYSGPDSLLITSSTSHPQSISSPTVSSSDAPQITSTIPNTDLNSQRCVILGTNDKPQDFVATGTVLYFPGKESATQLEATSDPKPNFHRISNHRSAIGPNLHRNHTDQRRSPSPNSRTVEDETSEFTIMKARRVEFISTTARRVQIKDIVSSSGQIPPKQAQSTSEVGYKNIELNSSRGSKSESKILGQSWSKVFRKRTHNSVGKNDISKNEHVSIDEDSTEKSQKILKRSKGFETPSEPQAVDDPLAEFMITITQLGIQNTRPKLISLEEAQKNEERRKAEFSRARAGTSRSVGVPEDIDESLYHKSVSLDDFKSKSKPMEDDVDHQEGGALKSFHELIALSEAQNHRKQKAQGEEKGAGVPTITKRHASGPIPYSLDSTDEITEMYALKRRRSNIQAHSHAKGIF